MPDTEIQKLIELFKTVLHKVKTDKEYSKKLLSKTGIYNADGSLSNNYGGK